jgi:DNA polymerase I-like protein with 3'-5' exonuclease and polymerase domains
VYCQCPAFLCDILLSFAPQGSAADLAKLVMCAWDAWAESQAAAAAAAAAAQPPGHNSLNSTSGAASSCARLIGQIHDELLFEVDASDTHRGPDGELQQPGQTVLHVAGVVRRVMEGAAPQLDVPLPVKLSWGSRWGSMATLEA